MKNTPQFYARRMRATPNHSGPRLVHRQSARKHRRRGDVVWSLGNGVGGHAMHYWLPGDRGAEMDNGGVCPN